MTHLSATGFRRGVGERAGPPYIGRGLIEAVTDTEIISHESDQKKPIHTSINVSSLFPECKGNDCIAGRHNENTSNNAFVGGDPAVRVGRFGVRAGGPTMLQFVVGGVQGEVGFTSPLLPTELTSFINSTNPRCQNTVPSPQAPESTPISLRALLRLTAPPEFGPELLSVMRATEAEQDRKEQDGKEQDRKQGSLEAKVRRGAELFGVDLVAFANRMIPGRMPKGGDGRDDHAIRQSDRRVNCAGCHLPVVATGQLPRDTGTSQVNNVWAPLFSDLLLHEGPSIEGERIVPIPRLPVVAFRQGSSNHPVPTFDLPRSLADDALPHQNSGIANGREFRTAPLMGIGRIGPPFLHDGRVYLSKLTASIMPASTVYSDAKVTNAPLVVQTVDDALRAAIELHDLPAPDRGNGHNRSDDDRHGHDQFAGGGCPTPLGGGKEWGGVTYPHGADDICPPYGSDISNANRSDSREVIARYRSLDAEDQQAIIEFLKQL